jgi:hypothetical protein
MVYYSLLIVDKQETLSGVAARDRAEAVAMFGQQLGRDLTLISRPSDWQMRRLDGRHGDAAGSMEG